MGFSGKGSGHCTRGRFCGVCECVIAAVQRPGKPAPTVSRRTEYCAQR
ncbi:hypothetical protein UCMB321_5101 [Pseudomonas batumici]|uniref:Uncharacterized protein n=1 Tax=Pseudomonas batumici TaxID=226910 RepID=A0A0C2HVD7_9PSED|nr:hypothetical protein UCMB321_5101 [Pseudomonas batumici]